MYRNENIKIYIMYITILHVVGRVFGSMRMNVREQRRKFIIRNFIIYSLYQVLLLLPKLKIIKFVRLYI